MNYFAYGSNMNPERLKERGVNFSQRRPAKLKGYNLGFNKMASDNPQKGHANIIPYTNGIVEGCLYEISETDLSKLDKYEGYHYNP